MSREEIMDDLQEPQPENYELEEFINEIRKYYKTHEFKRSVVNDCVSRQAAVYAVDSETVSTNPENFKSSEKFIKFMDDADIASFGKWQWANGFNTALVATTIQLEKLPSTPPQRIKGRWIRHPEQKNIYGGKCVECSECGEKYVVQYIEDEKYCRNCGADMRENNARI